jgi:hypothetical protein
MANQDPTSEVAPKRLISLGQEIVEHSTAMGRRMVIRLLHYWRGITCAGQRFRPLSHVNPKTLAKSWDWCYVLEAGAGVVGPGFSFIGSGFVNDLDGPLEDQTISGLEKRSLMANA